MLAGAHDQLLGRSLGGFVLRERIGEGGFGAVYRAHQQTLDREAVVKVLHSRLHASRPATERFLREARLASKLDHPYAAHIYAFGAEPDGELWIAMELVRGTPLDRILKIQGAMPLERFAPLLDRICEVVHTAHDQGIVHRDLKPANVMVLSRAGRLLPKLLDFGIAKGLASGEAPPDIGTGETLRGGDDVAHAHTMDGGGLDLGLTQRGAIMGSPPYMAPEQWLDAGRVDARTDLYALGVLAYELLTGKPPFAGATITAIAHAHAQLPPPPLGPRFPPALDKVFGKVLAKKSEDRYPDVLAFVSAFRQAAGTTPEAATLPSIDTVRRDLAANGAPQPIAEAVAALDAARNAHQARDALLQLARTIVRYLGLVALACRSRIATEDEPAAVVEAMRLLYRRALSDAEWLELGRQLTRSWLDRRDAYPVPELVDAFHGERPVVEQLTSVFALRALEAPDPDALVAQLDKAFAEMSQVLGAIDFLDAYPLVVTVAGGLAERWMGARRAQRATTPVRGKGLEAGVAALLDESGTPVLALQPLFQVAAPTPGAPLELFLLDGRDARGAKLVALPSGFEHHDDTLWDWFRAQLTGSLDDTQDAHVEDKAPYRGLSAFSADDGALFVGRERQIDAFVNRLKVQPLLAVVGRSGAGKSSFVHAGVIPALDWRAITMRPGASPLGALAARLELAGLGALPRSTLERDREALGERLRAHAATTGEPIVLVVDQLEEMFTLCQDGEERRAFAEAVSAAARSADDPVRVLFTLRDDFLVRTEQIPALRNRIGQGLQLLTVPAGEDLERILVEPARRVGFELEGDLAAEMVKEVADQPGALALISFTAAKLWELRDRHFKQLTRAAYKTLGGVGGALARHADVTLDGMPPEERALTREAFRHLVTTQNTRAVLSRKELRQLLGSSEHADRVIEKLVGARLLVASEDESGGETIEIVHEALLVAWPRLVEWRRDDAEGARFREQLRAAANQWQERGRPKGLLWRGDALGDFTRWRARHPGPLTDVEAAFGDASLADANRGRRNRRMLLAGAFASLVTVVVGLVVFNARLAGQRKELHDNLQRQYEQQGRRLVLDGDPLRALAYLEKSAELGESGRAHDFLVAEAVQQTDGELFEVHHELTVQAASFSRSGDRLITASDDHHARLWDARTGASLFDLAHGGAITAAALAPDGATALTASEDKTAGLWDARTGQRLEAFPHAAAVRCALYTPDGKLAVTAGEDDAVVIWDLATHRERHRMHGDGAGFNVCTISSDGTRLAVSDLHGTVWIWTVATGELERELATGHDRQQRLRFSSDGKLLAAASVDGSEVVWDATDGRRLYELRGESGTTSIAFSPDGRWLAAPSADHDVIVCDAASGDHPRRLVGHVSRVRLVAFSPDGKFLVTGAEDGSAWLWTTQTWRVVARWRGHQDGVRSIEFDPSGERVVTASEDGTAIVWSVRPQERATQLVGHTAGISSVAFSPDGRLVATTANDGTARVWDAATGREIAVLRGHEGWVSYAAFSADGRMVVTGGMDGTVRIWDVASSGLVRTMRVADASISQVSWSPDGTLIAASAEDAGLRVWEAATGALRFEKHGSYKLRSAVFTPSGKGVVTSGDDPMVRVWSLDGSLAQSYRDAESTAHLSAELDSSETRLLTADAKQTAKIVKLGSSDAPIRLIGHVGFIGYATWNAAGTMVITSSLDATARIWDAETGDMLAIFTHPGIVSVATFSPDGKRIAVAGYDGSAAIYELPAYRGSRAELDHLLRCRVPYVVQGDRVDPRKRDEHGCDRT